MKLILSLHMYTNIQEPAKKDKTYEKAFWGFLFPDVYFGHAPPATSFISGEYL